MILQSLDQELLGFLEHLILGTVHAIGGLPLQRLDLAQQVLLLGRCGPLQLLQIRIPLLPFLVASLDYLLKRCVLSLELLEVLAQGRDLFHLDL